MATRRGPATQSPCNMACRQGLQSWSSGLGVGQDTKEFQDSSVLCRAQTAHTDSFSRSHFNGRHLEGKGHMS